MPDPLQAALNPDSADAFDPAASDPAPPAAEPAKTPARDPETGQFKKPLPTGHSAGLRTRAKEYLGLEDAEIDEYTADQLTRLVINAQDRALREQRTQANQRIVADTSPTPDPEEWALDLGANEDGSPATLDDVNPVIARTIKSLEAEVRQLRGKTKKIDELDQRDQLRTASSFRAMVDEAFEALGETGAKLFGEGSISEISPAEAKRRNAVLGAAGIERGDDTPRVIARKIKAAVNELYPESKAPAKGEGYDLETEPAKRKGSVRVEEWNDGAVAKPTQRKDQDLPPGRERAIRGVAQRLASDRTTRPVDAADLDGVPN